MTALLEVGGPPRRPTADESRAVKGISFKVDAVSTRRCTSSAPTAPAKTTTLRTLSRLLKPVGGQIRFGGKSLKKVPRTRSSRWGSPTRAEGRHIFPRMTIEDNLRLGAFLPQRPAGASTKDIQRAYDLPFPILGERRKQGRGHPVRR